MATSFLLQKILDYNGYYRFLYNKVIEELEKKENKQNKIDFHHPYNIIKWIIQTY